MPTIHVFDLVEQPEQHGIAGVNVLFGDEPFLKQLGTRQLRRMAFAGQDQQEVPFATYDGATAEWRDVRDELSTYSLFAAGCPRLVLVQSADDFVRRFRGQLEDYLARPGTTGTLVLEVKKWPGNTRLYARVEADQLQIACGPPEVTQGRRKTTDLTRIGKFLEQWTWKHNQTKLAPQATQLLLELVGLEFGLLDQELAKLSLYVAPSGTISPDLVRDVVGGWRAKTTWEMIDAAASGDTAEALVQLDRLLQSGEHPASLFGQISWSLRRFAAATRYFQRAERTGKPITLEAALLKAGFRQWPTGALTQARAQLKHLGRQRAGDLYRLLLDTDLALKGSHSTPHRARFALEKLVMRMAQPAHRPARRQPSPSLGR